MTEEDKKYRQGRSKRQTENNENLAFISTNASLGNKCVVPGFIQVLLYNLSTSISSIVS